jgi:hypothetical protein
MGAWVSVPVAGGAYSDDCKPWSVQDTVNRIPVNAEREGTRTPAMLRDLPGCATFAVLGTDAPIRGMHSAEGLLLVVSGTSLFKLTTIGTVTNIGTIPGVGRVSFAHNQITGGNEVAIGNGQSGYVYNTKAGTLTQITDSGFPGAKVVDFVDGYIVGVEPSGRFWYWSDLVNAGSYNAIDRSEAESQPDRIVSLKVSHREVVVFGERTTEFFRNVGTGTGTFQRIDGSEMEVGCAATHSVARLDNSLFWLGNDGCVYRLNGYQPVRISTHAMEQAISRCTLSQAYAYTFEDRGHKVYYLTFTDGQTWGYDVATQEWHRRESYGLGFWRMADLVRWNGAWIGGDYSNGKLYQLDWALSNEAGIVMERRRVFAVAHNDENRFVLNAVKIRYNTGITRESPPLPDLIVDVDPVSGNFLIDGALGDGYTGDVETGRYTITGGVQPVTCVVTTGTLPAGLTLASDGSWSGTRTTAGTYSWTVTATDADGNAITINDTSHTRVSLLMADNLSYSWDGAAFNSYAGGVIDWLDSSVFPQASANGAVVAYRKAGNSLGISRWNSATGAFVAQTITGTVPSSSGSSMNAVTISADGKWVAVSCGDLDAILVYQYTGTGYANTGVSYSFTNPRTVKFSPDGTQIFMGHDRNGRVAAFNTTTGAIGATVWDVNYSGGLGNFQNNCYWIGNVIAFVINGGGSTDGIRLVNATTGAVGSTYMPTGATLMGTNSFAFDGTRIVAAYQKAGPTYAVRVALVSGTTVGSEGTEVAKTNPVLGVHFSPQGGTVAMASSTTRSAYTIASTTLTAITAPASGFLPYLWVGFLP